jgi:hypothetical protein
MPNPLQSARFRRNETARVVKRDHRMSQPTLTSASGFNTSTNSITTTTFRPAAPTGLYFPGLFAPAITDILDDPDAANHASPQQDEVEDLDCDLDDPSESSETHPRYQVFFSPQL